MNDTTRKNTRDHKGYLPFLLFLILLSLLCTGIVSADGRVWIDAGGITATEGNTVQVPVKVLSEGDYPLFSLELTFEKSPDADIRFNKSSMKSGGWEEGKNYLDSTGKATNINLGISGETTLFYLDVTPTTGNDVELSCIPGEFTEGSFADNVYPTQKTYTATPNPAVLTVQQSYTITWDVNGTTTTTTVAKGETPVYSGSTDKQADETYTYTFSGWDDESGTHYDIGNSLPAASADATYTATYEREYIDYAIRFLDWDESVISEETLHYGDTITAPVDPVRAANETYTYTFTGWSPSVPDTVTGSADYKAVYESEYIDYTIRFLDDDATELATATLHYGDTITPPVVPDKPADHTYTYPFSGWTPAVPQTVTGSADYTATYTQEYIEYRIVFTNWDRTEVSNTTLHYGDTVTAPADPVREADETYRYTFAGWNPAVAATVTGNAAYTAIYNGEFIDYTVRFLNWDRTELSTTTYHYGAAVTVPADPVRPADKIYTYAFSGWEPQVTPTVEKNADYLANYTAAYIPYTVTVSASNGTVTAQPGTSHYGETVTLTAAADIGYTFGSYRVTNQSGGEVLVTGSTFTMPAEDVTVTGTFIALPLPTVIHPDIATVGLPVTLQVTYPGTDASYRWNISGTISTDTTGNITHTFTTAGTYAVSVNATNQSGISSDASFTLTIRDAKSDPEIIVILDPETDGPLGQGRILQGIFDARDAAQDLTRLIITGKTTDAEKQKLNGRIPKVLVIHSIFGVDFDGQRPADPHDLTTNSILRIQISASAVTNPEFIRAYRNLPDGNLELLQITYRGVSGGMHQYDVTTPGYSDIIIAEETSPVVPPTPVPVVSDNGGADDGLELLAQAGVNKPTPTATPTAGTPTVSPTVSTKPTAPTTTASPAPTGTVPVGTETTTPQPTSTQAPIPVAGLLLGMGAAALILRRNR